MDFSNVKELEPLPEGMGTFTITKAEKKTSKGGDFYINLNCELQDLDGSAEDFGRNLFGIISLKQTDGAMRLAKQNLEAIGILNESNMSNFNVDEVLPDFVGRSFKAPVKQEPYQNPDTNEVTIRNKLGGFLPIN
jgi:hypothetical protein